MKTRGKLLSLMVVIALLGFTGSAPAEVSKKDPRVKEIVDSPPFGSFMKAIDKGKCNTEGVCKDEKSAGKANRRLKGVKRTIKSRFGTTLAPDAYGPVLGDWENVKFTFASVNLCNPNPCQNGGVCSDAGGKVACDCSGTGFKGDRCQKKKDDTKTKWCASLRKRIPLKEKCPPCPDGTKLRKGKCVPKGQKPPVDLCDPNPCQNGGTCSDVDNKVVCECGQGWAGDLCEETAPVWSPIYGFVEMGSWESAYLACPEGSHDVELEGVVRCECDNCEGEILTPLHTECDSFAERHFVLLAWLTVGLPLLLLALACFLVWFFYLRKRKEPVKPTDEGGEEVGPKAIPDIVEEAFIKANKKFPEHFVSAFRKLVTFFVRNLGDSNPEVSKAADDAVSAFETNVEAEKLAKEAAPLEDEESLDESSDDEPAE